MEISDAERRFWADGLPLPEGFADPGVCVLRNIIDCDLFRSLDLENSLIAYNQLTYSEDIRILRLWSSQCQDVLRRTILVQLPVSICNY